MSITTQEFLQQEIRTCNLIDGRGCSICGNFFAKGATACPNEHRIGEDYEITIRRIDKPKAPPTTAQVGRKTIICQVVDACKCNICGGFIGPGEEICANGHYLGQVCEIQ